VSWDGRTGRSPPNAPAAAADAEVTLSPPADAMVTACPRRVLRCREEPDPSRKGRSKLKFLLRMHILYMYCYRRQTRFRV
jgi:hypothetical protein